MRLLSPLLALLLSTTSAVAQATSDLPACSLSCFSKAQATTPCAASDLLCQCQPPNAAAIKESVTTCLATSSTCSVSDLQKVQTWSRTFCPSVLSSAAAPSNTDVVVTITAFTPPPTSSLPPPRSPSAVSLGAGTPGTSWSSIPQSTADRGPALSAISIILVSLATILILLRLFARIFTQHERAAVRGIWWDDAFAVVGLLLTAGVTADIVVGGEYSIGRHLPADIGRGEMVGIFKVIYAFVVVVTAALGAVKFSVLCLYLRMTPDRRHRRVIGWVTGVVVLRYLVVQVISIVPCNPISEYWSLTTPLLRNPHCIDILPFTNFNNAFSVLEDIVIWALPLPTIHKLSVPRAKKLPLYVLFGVSAVSVVCSVLRMAMFVAWMRSSDISWNYPLVPFFSNVEACVALGAGCAPALLPLWRSLMGGQTAVAGAEGQSGPQPGRDVEKAPATAAATDANETTTAHATFTSSSRSSTAVPMSSASAPSSRRLSKTWSLLSSKWRPLSNSTLGKGSKRVSWNFMGVNTEGNITTLKSGTRTEVKEIDGEDLEGERGMGVMPGLMPWAAAGGTGSFGGTSEEEKRVSWRGSLGTVDEEGKEA